LKPPRPATVADTSLSSGGVSTPAPRCRVPAPTPPLGGPPPPRVPPPPPRLSAAGARIGCTPTTPASPSQRGDQTDARPAGRDADRVMDVGIRDAANADLSGLVDDLRRQMTAAHPAPVATIP